MNDRARQPLVLAIADRSVTLSGDGDTFELPVGPTSLTAEDLSGDDPPSPEALTNALGVVRDRLEDVAIESPELLATDSLVATGPHAVALARVEQGADEVPPRCRIARADVDEVFRTLVAETAADRAHNPGLPADHVDTIVATCCIVLAVLRRLDLDHLDVGLDPDTTATEG